MFPRTAYQEEWASAMIKKRIKRYPKEQIEWVRKHALGRWNDELAKMFNQAFPGANMTTEKMRALKTNHKIRSGLQYKGRPWPEHKRKFTPEQEQFIRNHVKGTPFKKLTKMLNDEFGTNFEAWQIHSYCSNRKLKNGLIGGRFEKGQAAFNKGKKWADFMTPEGQANSRKTQFKKGQINGIAKIKYKPIGSETKRADGYIWVKIAKGKWIQKHHLVWELHYGPIPPGHVIVFLDGNICNCDITNLILASRGEVAVANSKKLLVGNPELRKAGILISRLLIKTTKKLKEVRNGNKEQIE